MPNPMANPIGLGVGLGVPIQLDFQSNAVGWIANPIGLRPQIQSPNPIKSHSKSNWIGDWIGDPNPITIPIGLRPQIQFKIQLDWELDLVPKSNWICNPQIQSKPYENPIGFGIGFGAQIQLDL